MDMTCILDLYNVIIDNTDRYNIEYKIDLFIIICEMKEYTYIDLILVYFIRNRDKYNINNVLYNVLNILCINGNIEIVKIILDFIEINKLNIDIHRDCESLFVNCCKNRKFELCEYILKFYAEINDRINIHVMDEQLFDSDIFYDHMILKYSIETGDTINVHSRNNNILYRSFIFDTMDILQHMFDVKEYTDIKCEVCNNIYEMLFMLEYIVCCYNCRFYTSINKTKDLNYVYIIKNKITKNK